MTLTFGKKFFLPSTAFLVVSVLMASVLVLMPKSAEALIELKAGYSMHQTSPGGLNDAFPLNPKIDQMTSLSIDVMANLPLMPLGLGVRHEIMKRSATSGTFESSIDWSRTSILVNHRIIDTLAYVGPIATIGVASDFKYHSSASGVTTDYKTDSQFTATVGVEAGVKFLLLRLGAEIGYLYAPMGELKSSTGTPVTNTDGSKVTFDMSGTYVRILAGFGF
ncbi:hypothetical protein BH10BDE1_BH10BDE1_19550 [soil metagenome]